MGSVYKRKNIWWIKYRRNGRSYWESARTTNHAEAKRLLAQREGDSSRGIPVTPQIGKLTFDEAMADLLTNQTLTRRRSIEKVRGRITNHLLPVFTKRRMSDLMSSDFADYAVARQAEGAADGTINRELTLVLRAYKLAKQAGKLLHVPHVPMLAEAAPRSGFFTSDEIERLIKELPAHLKPVVRFGYLTGWRLREILNLQWSNVDFEAGEVRLHTSKNGEGRVIVMTTQLRDLLVQQRSLVRWMFHRNGLPIKQLRKPWATACKRAELVGRHFHDLRRSAVRNFVRSGILERVVMRMVGHKTRSMLDRYNIVSPGDLVEAAAKLDAVSR